MSELEGYIFGYGSLADYVEPLGTGGERVFEPQYTEIDGFIRDWIYGAENCAKDRDSKHYVDAESGERPDMFVVSLGLAPAIIGRVNGLAIPVNASRLAEIDHRERGMARVDITTGCSHDLCAPVWTYVVTPEGCERFLAAKVSGRAFVGRRYMDRVERAFRAISLEALSIYHETTPAPSVPIRDLVLHRHERDQTTR